MIWLLRNISVHLWLAVLFTIPAVFAVLLLLGPVFPGFNPAVTAIVIFVTVFTVFGSLMDVVARKMLSRLIKEGQTWERSGVASKAHKAYVRAIRIYDTFLFWPFFSRQTAVDLCGAIARFKINSALKHPGFDLACAVYLKRDPEDEDVALPWLKSLRDGKAVSTLEQEVLTVLAQYHYDKPMFSQILTDLFLGLERKDFVARKLYRHAQSTNGPDAEYDKHIENLIGEPDQMENMIAEPDQPLERPSPVIPPVSPPVISPRIKPVQKIQVSAVLKKGASSFVDITKKTGTILGAVLSAVILTAGRVFTWVKESKKARVYLKTAFLSVVFIWLAFFMINTISHMFKSRVMKKGADKQIQVQVPKPFTIQVAAYLKQSHADRYVATLKKKKINASVKKAAGGGKTWYLVQVSEFVDKQSAAAYGKKLKQQKIIEDFFVNNK